MKFTQEEREKVATILLTVEKEGLPMPRDLDVALDAIESSIGSRVPTYLWILLGYGMGTLVLALTVSS